MAVIGVPNEEFGEEVKAVVQPVAGVAGRRALAASCWPTRASTSPATSAHARSTSSDELPRLPTGKLYKRLLRDRYWGTTESRIV